MQLQADLLGTEVARPKNLQTTALGAAYLAGLATGYWKDREELPLCPARDTPSLRPGLPTGQRQEERTRWRKLVETARAWADGVRA